MICLCNGQTKELWYENDRVIISSLEMKNSMQKFSDCLYMVKRGKCAPSWNKILGRDRMGYIFIYNSRKRLYYKRDKNILVIG